MKEVVAACFRMSVTEVTSRLEGFFTSGLSKRHLAGRLSSNDRKKELKGLIRGVLCKNLSACISLIHLLARLLIAPFWLQVQFLI